MNISSRYGAISRRRQHIKDRLDICQRANAALNERIVELEDCISDLEGKIAELEGRVRQRDKFWRDKLEEVTTQYIEDLKRKTNNSKGGDSIGD